MTDDYLADLTLEQLKRDHPDLCAQINDEIRQKQAAEHAQLQSQIARHKLIDQALAESALPLAKVSGIFRETLLEAKDEATVRALIEDRVGLLASQRPQLNGFAYSNGNGNGHAYHNRFHL